MILNLTLFRHVPKLLQIFKIIFVRLLIYWRRFRYITGEVSSVVMKSDEKIVKARAELEAVETLLHDKRIPRDLAENIRHHFRQSQSSNSLDQSALYR